MTAIYERAPALVDSFESVVPTGAAQDSQLTSQDVDPARRGAWDRLIDRCLVEWARDPETLRDEDFVPPSPAAIRMACECAQRMRDRNCPPPLRMVPDGEGGITFEWVSDPWFSCVNLGRRGEVEIETFRDCRLVTREIL
jgi:hypothetical protein